MVTNVSLCPEQHVINGESDWKGMSDTITSTFRTWGKYSYRAGFEDEQYCIVSVLGREEGYTVKYTPLPEGVPKGEAQGYSEGKGVYLTVYPELSPNRDSISFKQSYS